MTAESSTLAYAVLGVGGIEETSFDGENGGGRLDGEEGMEEGADDSRRYVDTPGNFPTASTWFARAANPLERSQSAPSCAVIIHRHKSM
ncbi:hypothetical protein AB1Y20_012543 [Prymnesium parvum]|uniref:Uncharacterized protein n=1 Tax=Prymnesium parvum TaxID=97485 RepID=A0AB34IIT2_PRYPA